MSKSISLSNGGFAIVDDEWYEMLSTVRWCQSDGYAKCVRESMHRIIMDAPKGTDVDHKNHNPLDNRTSNIRLCTQTQNNGNQRKTRGVSKYKGVSWHKKSKKWRAQINVNRMRTDIGYFVSEIEAAKAYDAAAQQEYGQFAFLNFALAEEKKS